MPKTLIVKNTTYSIVWFKQLCWWNTSRESRARTIRSWCECCCLLKWICQLYVNNMTITTIITTTTSITYHINWQRTNWTDDYSLLFMSCSFMYVFFDWLFVLWWRFFICTAYFNFFLFAFVVVWTLEVASLVFRKLTLLMAVVHLFWLMYLLPW